MIILIPMGGKGSRFLEAGYTENNACLLTTDRHSGEKLPMIICAMKDLPGIQDKENTIICIDRKFHEENGNEKEILKRFKDTIFIHDNVLLDQAYGCYLAKDHLNKEEELLIGACDNGIDIDLEAFEKAKLESDALMISHSNDENIAQNPEAHSWAKLKDDGNKMLLFFKKPKRDKGVGFLKIESGDDDKLFGSVTSTMICDAIQAQGYKVNKKEIQLEEPIKHLGNHFVEIHLDTELTAKIKIKVSAAE